MTRRRAAGATESTEPTEQIGAGAGRVSRLGRRRPRHGEPSSAVRPQRQAMGAFVLHDLADFTLTAAEPLPFQVDGDALDKRDYVRFREIPEALEVFV
jgi:hypothetical protein